MNNDYSFEEACRATALRVAKIVIAKQHNIYDDTTLQYLKSDEDRDNLLAEELQARELGIKGVPCFIINRKFVLLGAHDKNKFLDIFNKINK